MRLHPFCRARIAANVRWWRFGYAARWAWLMATRADWELG